MAKRDERYNPTHPRHRELLLECCALGQHVAVHYRVLDGQQVYTLCAPGIRAPKDLHWAAQESDITCPTCLIRFDEAPNLPFHKEAK